MENDESAKQSGRFLCLKCDESFSRKDNLKRHYIRRHKEIEYIDDSVNKTQCLYPGCDKQFYHKGKMLEHLEQSHDVELKVERLEFRSLEDFLSWKGEEETTKCVYFSKHTGNTRSNISDISYYNCQREGFDRTVTRKSSRRHKRGVTKTGHICPARMVVCVSLETGFVSVKYIKSHNHLITPKDIEHHPIPAQEREQLRMKETMGISSRKAIKEWREQRKSMFAGSHLNIISGDNDKRHNHGIKIPDSDIIEEDGGWKIASKTKETIYFITRLNESCTFEYCFNKCLNVLCLGLCGHLYGCTCEDTSDICKHIHKIHSLLIAYKFSDNDKQENVITEPEPYELEEFVIKVENDNDKSFVVIEENDNDKSFVVIEENDNDRSFVVVEENDDVENNHENNDDTTLNYIATISDKLDEIKERVVSGSVHKLLLPHINETLEGILVQCNVDITCHAAEN